MQGEVSQRGRLLGRTLQAEVEEATRAGDGGRVAALLDEWLREAARHERDAAYRFGLFVRAFGNLSDADRAVAALRSFCTAGLTPSMRVVTMVLQLLRKTSNQKAARAVWDCVLAQNDVNLDAEARAMFAAAAQETGDVTLAQAVLEHISRTGRSVMPNGATMAMLVKCFAAGRDAQRCADVLVLSQTLGLTVVGGVLLTAIGAATETQNVAAGIQIHQLLRNTTQFDVKVATALLHMYGKCGRIAEARELFDQMTSHHDAIMYGAMTVAYASVGDARGH